MRHIESLGTWATCNRMFIPIRKAISDVRQNANTRLILLVKALNLNAYTIDAKFMKPKEFFYARYLRDTVIYRLRRYKRAST